MFYVISCSIYLFIPIVSVGLYFCYMTLYQFPLFDLIFATRKKFFLNRRNQEIVNQLCLQEKPVTTVTEADSSFSFFSSSSETSKDRYFYLIAPRCLSIKGEITKSKVYDDDKSTEKETLNYQSSILLEEKLSSSSLVSIFCYSFLFCDIVSPLLRYLSSYMKQYWWSLVFGSYSKFNETEISRRIITSTSTSGHNSSNEKYPQLYSVFCRELLQILHLNMQKSCK